MNPDIYKAGMPPRQINSLNYVGETLSSVPVVNVARAPRVTDNQFPLFTLWRNSNPSAVLPDAEGDLWYFAKVDTTVYPEQYIWLKIASGTVPGGTMIGLKDTLGTSVLPTGAGFIQLAGGAGITVTADPVNNKLVFALGGGGLAIDSIAVPSGTSPVVPDVNGLITFNVGTGLTLTGALNAMTFGIAGGGIPLQRVTVDAATAPGTNPVLATSTGGISVTGGQVAAGVVGTNVIRTDSLAANTYTVEIQRSTTAAVSTVASNGVSHYDVKSFGVDANAYVTAKNNTAGGVSNLGIGYNGGTGVFTVFGQNGVALSASNPGYVTLPNSAIPGQLTTIPVTANQTFIDSNGASTIIGNLWNTTNALAYPLDLPFFLYAVVNDAQTAISFMISRIPSVFVSPPSTKIAVAGSAVATTQGSFFALGNPTVTLFDGNPCICIGAFRMQKNSSNDWTVQTLSNGVTGIGNNVDADGIGSFHSGSKFQVATGQFGAATGSFFGANGGTAPIWTQQNIGFTINKDGSVLIDGLANTNTTPGAGAVAATLQLPFNRLSGGSTGTYTSDGFMGVVQAPTDGQVVNFTVTQTGTGNLSMLTNAQIGSASLMELGLKYQADVA